ncbi:MAG TPA: glycosyltransferase [Phycisphaerales bacterium]|nr:glycosyltransferase [Phycisphaerales bacterium]
MMLSAAVSLGVVGGFSMRVLMLGWEFPPFIAGGLGIACYGLTKALDKQGHSVIFVLPKPVDRSKSSHVKMLSPMSVAGVAAQGGLPLRDLAALSGTGGTGLYQFQHAVFHGVPASFSNPYPGNATQRTQGVGATKEKLPAMDSDGALDIDPALIGAVDSAGEPLTPQPQPAQQLKSGTERGFIGSGGGAGVGYGNDLVGDAERYARLCVALTRREDFDIIHAHDWLTFPAAIAVAKVTGKPLIVQIHSTEFDRSGSNVNQRVYDIERAGMHAADKVVCVSQLTANICERRYGVPANKLGVVYNGLDKDAHQPAQGAHIETDDKIVLFLGRITMQKGPEYFIAAAKRVLEKVPDAKFVLAGSGDMALRMIDLAASMGIGGKVLFTGFLRGGDIERVFKMADCYVMPSVSEPFGIAALEAISHDVPVILSKTSGASEVLQHVLKVDFWDIDEMANKIVSVLRHPSLSQTLRDHGRMELHRLTWDQAATNCVKVYEGVIAERNTRAATA